MAITNAITASAVELKAAEKNILHYYITLAQSGNGLTVNAHS